MNTESIVMCSGYTYTLIGSDDGYDTRVAVIVDEDELIGIYNDMFNALEAIQEFTAKLVEEHQKWMEASAKPKESAKAGSKAKAKTKTAA